MKKNMSWGEVADCGDYAERVIEFHKSCYDGELPMDASAADWAIREYNKKHESFKSLYGYSIRGYIDDIIFQIGCMVEC